MPKCVVCGGPVDWIELMGDRVADDCPRCATHGRNCCDLQDPTPPEVDDRVTSLRSDLAELSSLLEDVRRGWDAEILQCVKYRSESEGRLAELVRLVREMETMKADLAFEKAENARWEVVCDEMEAERDRLRGLLREMVLRNGFVDDDWWSRAQAALEGKP
jgi:hypothetical protein